MKSIDSDNHLWELYERDIPIFRFDADEGEYIRLRSENDVALFNNLGHALYH